MVNARTISDAPLRDIGTFHGSVCALQTSWYRLREVTHFRRDDELLLLIWVKNTTDRLVIRSKGVGMSQGQLNEMCRRWHKLSLS